MLNEEQATDAELREKFGQKWTRKPSAELTAPLRQGTCEKARRNVVCCR